MAAPLIKSTFRLDPETVRKVERLAQHWKLSKSEAVQRAITEAAEEKTTSALTPLEAWRKVQKELNLSSVEVRAWEKESMRIIRNAFRNREWTRP